MAAPAVPPLAPVEAPRALPATLARAALVVALLGLAWQRTLERLWDVWRSNDSYSHGPLVPLVALALVWQRRRALAAVPAREDARGLLLVAASCAMLVAGIRADLFALQGHSIVVMAFGLALTFQGPARTRRLLVPLAYLAFMLPFPPIVVNELSFALKEVTVRLSTALADGLGVLVQRHGMSLWLEGGELRVENPCSGLRSLVALMATGALFAVFQPGGPWRRAAVFLCTIPVAMLGNVVRLTMLLVVAHYVGVEEAAGRFHDLSGIVLYAASLAGLLAVRALLSPRRSGEPPPPPLAARRGGTA